jgi:hypothetical protein
MDVPRRIWLINPKNRHFVRYLSKTYYELLGQGIIDRDIKLYTNEEKIQISENQRTENRKSQGTLIPVQHHVPRDDAKYYVVFRNGTYVGTFFATRAALVQHLRELGIGENEAIDVIDVKEQARNL